MIHAVYPGLGVGLSAVDGANVVGFAVVVPGDYFSEVEAVSIGDYGLPS